MLKSKDKERLTNLENEIKELKNEIDFLYDIVQPSVEESKDDDYYAGPTTDIPADIYDKIREYCENKNFIFMGIA